MDNEQPSRSPTPQKIEVSDPTPPSEPVFLSFYDALKLVVTGKKITRANWGNKDIYAFIRNEILLLHGGVTGDGQDHTFTVGEGDITATDWVVIDE